MLRKALQALQGEHAALVGDVVDGRRLLWLGSGISYGKAPGLTQVLNRVLLFLRDGARSQPDGGAHRAALLEILGAHLPSEVDKFNADPTGWIPPNLDSLRQSYSKILGVRVGDRPSDYLVMTAADVPNTFGAPSLSPGSAHRLLAVLVAEGVVKEIASGNWDGLVEAAVMELTDQPGLLDVYVLADDGREGNSVAQIAKFHGCAVLARTDPDRYAAKIIATRAQISRFDNHATFEHMRAALKERTTKYRSLVLGLSLQDLDLLAVFTCAAENHPWVWEAGHPAYVFAEPQLHGSQCDVLENSYGDEFDKSRRDIIEKSAFGTYAEPLLGALVLEVLLLKLLALLHRQATVDTAIEKELANGLRRVAALLALSVGDDSSTLLSFLAGQYAAFVRQYLGLDSSHCYVPMVRATRVQISFDHSVAVTGVDLLAVAVGLLGWGDLNRLWRVRGAPNPGSSGGVRIADRETGRIADVAIVRGSREADSVFASEAWILGAGRMAVLYMCERPRSATRYAGSKLGTGRRMSNRFEASWADLADHCKSSREIVERMKTEVGL